MKQKMTRMTCAITSITVHTASIQHTYIQYTAEGDCEEGDYE